MTARKIPLDGCYRAIDWMPRQEDCEHWLEWYEEKGVPAAIVCKNLPRRKKAYTVIRNGIESKMDVRNPREETFDPETLHIVDYVLDFELNYKWSVLNKPEN